jgi:hypothetical protein
MQEQDAVSQSWEASMLVETTMRYDPERDAVWIWQDRHDPFLVPRATIEDIAGLTGLDERELFTVCKDREAVFADIATHKYDDGEIDPDGRITITSADLH